MSRYRIRRGNDVAFAWTVLQKNSGGVSAAYSLVGKNIKVLANIYNMEIELTGLSVSGNILSFTWPGKDQPLAGPARLRIVENDGAVGMRTMDAADIIEFVDDSNDAGGCNPCSHIDISLVELASIVTMFNESAIPDTIARKSWVTTVLTGYYTKEQADQLLAQKYVKPGSGIPKTDLAADVQASLEKADTALQQHQDISGKQDVIEDLETIRSGAGKGATAYQKPQDGIPSSDMASAVKQALTAAGTALQPADIVTLTNKVAALESLISEGDNPTAAIDKFNEIVAFLSTITNTQTLAGIVSGINDAIAAKYTKPGSGIPKTDLAAAVQASLEKADSALQQHQDISGKAEKAANPVAGNLAKLDEHGNLVNAGFSADRIHRDLGYNANQSIIHLTQGIAGEYVKCATRAAESNANFAISAQFNVDACSELLIKTGFNPSDGNHAALDLSVIAIVEELERVRTVQAKDGSNNPLYYEVDLEGNPTSTQTTEVTDYPVYVQETYTETRYLPNNEDRYVAIPDSGYYVANIPQSCKCVISYKPGVTDMDVIVVKHGALANLTSQIFGIYEHRVMVEALTALAYRIQALEASIRRPGDIVVGTIDAQERTTDGIPDVLYGHGTPSASTVPVNWPADAPEWDGIPPRRGSEYHNLDATTSPLWRAKDNTAVSDWINV